MKPCSPKRYSQKRPDVHKIVLSIKLRFPPPGKSVNFEDFLLICAFFPHFGPSFFWGGGVVKPNFADKNFMNTQTFLIFGSFPINCERPKVLQSPKLGGPLLSQTPFQDPAARSCRYLAPDFLKATTEGGRDPKWEEEIRHLTYLAEDFSLLVAFLLVTFSWLFR